MRVGGLETSRASDVTRLNAAAIVELVRRSGSISRAEIARSLELSPATVTRTIGRLLESGVVSEHDRGLSRGGRPPVMLAYNPRAAALIGVDVGGTKIAAVLSDLDGRFLTRRVVPTWPDGGGPAGLDAVVAAIEDLLTAQEIGTMPLRGLAVGVPGVTRHREGIVEWSPGLNWRDLPLAAILRQRFQRPVFIENDVNLSALGEYARGAGQGVNALVGLFIGTGIGAGIVMNGQLYRGANEAAGEVGYLLLERQALGRAYPRFGAFESIAAGPGIARRAADAVAAGTASDATSGGARLLTTPAVLAAALAGDRVANDVLAETLDFLALAIGNVACVLNPQRVILGGAVGLALQPWYGEIVTRLEGRIPHVPEIVASALGVDAGLSGAVALARERTRDAGLGPAPE